MKLLTDEQVVALFGNPAQFLGADGRPGIVWESRFICYVTLPAPLRLSWDHAKWVTRFKAHRLVAPLLESAFGEIYDDHEAWGSINDFGGCYEFRRVRGSKVLSRHSWAIAIDFDVLDNPMFGLVPRVHPRVKAIMQAHGFVWGGATIWGGAFPWGRRDPMHFEFANASLLGGPA